MSTLDLIITDAGRAALTNAENNGTLPLVIKAVDIGSGTWAPDKTATALQNKIKRLDSTTGGNPAPDQLHVEAYDESDAVYSLGEFALVLDDPAETVFGIYSQTSPIQEKTPEVPLLLTADVQLASDLAGKITVGDTNFRYPQGTEQTKGVNRFSTLAETIAGLAADLKVSVKNLKAFITQWWENMDAPDSKQYARSKGQWSEVKLPDNATETKPGITREATLAEVIAGVLTGAFVSPAKLKAFIAQWWDQVRLWDNIKNKPATATRWPTAAEVNRYPGELAIFSTPTLPAGFPGFVLDGSTIPNGVNDFPELAASGSRFITISGNNIILSDQSDVIRGQGSSERNVGEFQSDAILNITGEIGVYGVKDDQGREKGAFVRTRIEQMTSQPGHDVNKAMNTLRFDASRVVKTAPENRVRSTTALFAICHGGIAA